MGIQVFEPTTNLGIPRDEMPQIDADDVQAFVQWVQDLGVGVDKGWCPASRLRATQSEINVDKVRTMLSDPKIGIVMQEPYLVSKEGYLLDGHHRWMALLTRDSQARVPVIKFDLPVREILDIANGYKGTTHRDITAAIMRVAAMIVAEDVEVFVPKKNLGISRSQMPQIKSTKVPEFLKWLEDQGVRVSREIAQASKLFATQREINNVKVKQMASDPVMGQNLAKPVIVSDDNYLLDGHHRWLALLTQDEKARMPIIRVGLGIRELLDMARGYEGVGYKDIAASVSGR